MNERIKELIAQAEIYAFDKQNERNEEDYECSFEDNFAEKLVHLVVWECAGIYAKVNSYSLTGEDEYIRALSKAFWDEE